MKERTQILTLLFLGGTSHVSAGRITILDIEYLI